MKKSHKRTIVALLMVLILGFGGTMPDAWLPGLFLIEGFAFEEGAYAYTVLNNEATITKYSGSEENLVIPDRLGSYIVTKIGERAFADSNGLLSVTVPEYVTVISNRAFFRCEKLTTVSLPDGLIRLESDAFLNCIELESINIPAGVNQGVNEIYQPFRGCHKLNNITFDIEIKMIPNKMFEDCRGLQTISIPSGVETIGNYSFYGSGLTSITIPEGVKRIGNGAFQVCQALVHIAIPESVTDIGDYAFANCRSITDITLPDGLIRLGRNAFNDCTKLTSVNIPAGMNQGTDNNYSPFINCENLNTVTFGEGIIKIPSGLFNGCTGLKRITIPSTVETIGNYSFANCPSLEEVIMQESITTIGSYAFLRCDSLERIVIPESVTSIGGNAFNGCTGLTAVTLPTGLIHLGLFAFTNCSELTSVNIPVGMNQGDNDNYWPFSGCESLSDITFDAGIKKIPNYLFDNCMGLQNITIPPSVEVIGNSAFKDCINLTEVIMQEPLISIGSEAFSNCVKLEELIIPDTVFEIGRGAFDNCPELTIHCGELSHALIYVNDHNIPHKQSDFKDSDYMILQRPGSSFAADVLTEDGRVNLNMEYTIKPGNQSLLSQLKAVFRLPEGTVLLEETLMSGDAQIIDFTYDNNLLIVPLSHTSGNITFSVMPAVRANFISNAILSFRQYPDINKTEVIGIINAELPNINVQLQPQDPPDAPTLKSKTSTNVILNDIPGAEYSCDGDGWQDSPVFSGLQPDTTYNFYARMKETDTHSASPESTALTVTTDQETNPDKGEQAAPAAPELKSKTSSSVTLNDIPGAEYRRENGDWQDGTIFTGLQPVTTYHFYARMKETETHYASPESEALAVTTDQETEPGTKPSKGEQAAPDAPRLKSKTSSNVTLVDMPGAEYRRDNGEWQGDTTFMGLQPGTTYRFYARMKETEDHNASIAGKPLAVTTDKAEQKAPGAPTLKNKTSNSVTLNSIPGAEYRRDNGAWQGGTVFNGLRPGTTYRFQARKKETGTHKASPAGTAASVTTNQLPQAIKPTVNKKSKTYTGKVKVKLTSKTSGAKIYYTTNKSKPNLKSKSVKSGKTITISTSMTLKVMAVAPGYQNSKIETIKYTIQTAKPGASAVPKSQSVKKGNRIKLTAPKGITLYYSTDGKKPTTKLKTKVKPKKSKQIIVNKNTTLKVIAKKSGCQESKVVTRNYKVKK